MGRRIQQCFIAALALTACGWAAFLVAGKPLTSVIARRWEATLARAADGKFDNPATFIHGRMEEGLMLATVGLLLIAATFALWRTLGNRSAWRPIRGLVAGVAVFLFLNVFAWSAGRTVLFWALFFDKNRIDNFAQYHIKRILMEECHGKRRAILLGSSQTNRAIDEVLLNHEIGRTIWTTELTQPGARGFDLLTLSRDIPLRRGDIVVCYLSEIMFHGSGSGIVAADFMNFSEVPDAIQLRGWSHFPEGAARSGLLGRILPLYRYRNSLSHRALGWDITHLEQRRFDQSLEADLEAQAKRRAPSLGLSVASRFEEAAFARMASELVEKGCTLVVISGDTHPALRRHMNPEVIAHQERFLTGLAALHPQGFVLLHGNDFFPARDSDFTDLVHFNDDSQRRFTLGLSRYLTDLPAVEAISN